MTRKVGIYARVSKAEKDDPTSVPVQIGDCRDRAQDVGWDVVDEYVDEGISAWSPKKQRPGYERLLADVAAGRVDTILVREQERLLRQMKDGTRIEELAANGKGNLKLIACVLEGDIDFSRARDRKDFHDRVSGAVFYSDFLSEKVRRTKARRVAAGTYTGGGPAFGYKGTPDGLAVDPEQATVIHEMVNRLAEHVTLYRITMDLNAAGSTTAGGTRWLPATIRRMLTGEHLTGGNGYPRILSDVEAAIVCQALGEQPKLKPGRPVGRRNPAVGLFRCSECGVKLTTGPGRYRCSASHGGCGAVSIKATPVERYLALEAFRHHVETIRNDGMAKKKTPAVALPDTTPILDDLHAVEKLLDEQAAQLAEGVPASVVAAASKKLEARRRELTELLARSLPPVARGPKLKLSGLFTASEVMSVGAWLRSKDFAEADHDFRERWDARQLTEVEIAQLLDLYNEYIDAVTICRRAKRGHAFYPSRVSIQWRDVEG